MRATVMHGAGEVRSENVPDARLIEPADVFEGRVEPGRVFDRVVGNSMVCRTAGAR